MQLFDFLIIVTILLSGILLFWKAFQIMSRPSHKSNVVQRSESDFFRDLAYVQMEIRSSSVKHEYTNKFIDIADKLQQLHPVLQRDVEKQLYRETSLLASVASTINAGVPVNEPDMLSNIHLLAQKIEERHTRVIEPLQEKREIYNGHQTSSRNEVNARNSHDDTSGSSD